MGGFDPGPSRTGKDIFSVLPADPGAGGEIQGRESFPAPFSDPLSGLGPLPGVSRFGIRRLEIIIKIVINCDLFFHISRNIFLFNIVFSSHFSSY